MSDVPRSRLVGPAVLPIATVAVAVVALDALTKAWARTLVAPRHVVGPLWWRLQYNQGVSFSWRAGSSTVVTVLTVVVALGVIAVALRSRTGLPATGFGLLIGGGVGNVVDRMTGTPHRVTDFISVGSFPVFNLADVSVTVGFVLLIVVVLRGDRLTVR